MENSQGIQLWRKGKGVCVLKHFILYSLAVSNNNWDKIARYERALEATASNEKRIGLGGAYVNNTRG